MSTSAIEMLPSQFTKSLRILFDILDEEKCGLVRLCDIESRWHEEGVHGLPSGVIDTLRKVTPTSGYLSFGDFVNGLKIALFKRDQAAHNRKIEKENRIPFEKKFDNKRSSVILEKENIGLGNNGRSRQSLYVQGSQSNNYRVTTAKVKPNNAINNQTLSKMKHDEKNIYFSVDRDKVAPPVPKPLHPSRENIVPSTVWRKDDGTVPHHPPKVPPRDYSKNVVNDLRNTLGHVNLKTHVGNQRREGRSHSVSDSKLMEKKSSGSNNLYANIDDVYKPKGGSYDDLLNDQKKPVKRESRRHTLADGVDYNMIKRLKQLEQEKDILLHGLDVVDQARDWYRKQLSLVTERQKSRGRNEQVSTIDTNLELHQERINFQKVRISEINQQIKSLVESSGKTFPSQVNLATQLSAYSEENTIKMLKEQNRLLTQEVSQKSDKISQLENEKTTLVRDLFEIRAKSKGSYDDSTFM
ncbi:hypothetical protein ScPMuIL_010069 [Solemya velum]